MKEKLKFYLLILFATGIFLTIFFFAGGADSERLYSRGYYHAQVHSLQNGELKLSPHIEALEFDLAWYNGGVQQIWGLGVPLWMWLFEKPAEALGGYCSDVTMLLTALGLLLFYTFSAGGMLYKRGVSSEGIILFCGFIVFSPPLWIFFWSPNGVYEIAGIYALICGLALLVGVVRYAAERRNIDFFIVCFLAGFSANIRPTYGIYGVAAGAVVLFLSLYERRAENRVRVWMRTLSGGLLILGGLLFLCWSNQVRFGSAFEFGHNLSHSAANIVYLTRFGNPCEEASLWSLCGELFFWIFTQPHGEWLMAPIPRWRDIYQPTFGMTWLVMLILCGVLFCGFIRVYRRALRGNMRHACGRIGTEESGVLSRPVMVFSLLFFFLLPFLVLALFYLRFATLSTRYIQDFAPALTAGLYCGIFCAAGRWKKWVWRALYLFLCWKLCFLVTTPAAERRWIKAVLGKDGIFAAEGKKIADFDGVYTLENHPVQTEMSPNGQGWNEKSGEAEAIVLLAVDRPEYLELILGKEKGDIEGVYRAKINNIELPREEIKTIAYGTNEAVRVRFSLTEEILRQRGDQLVSLCFSPSFWEGDMKRTRQLYQVRWRDKEDISDSSNPGSETQNQQEVGTPDNSQSLP